MQHGEGTSNFERIVGGTEPQKASARQELSDRVFRLDNTDLASYELLATERDERIIDAVMREVDTVVASYGRAASALPREKIHLLRPGAVREITGEPWKAFHSPMRQRVAVERSLSNVDFALATAHELFHEKSYKAAQIKEGEPSLYRSGLSMVSRAEGGKTEFFGELEEGIVCGMERAFYEKSIRTNPMFQAELKGTEMIKEWVRAYLRTKTELNEADRQTRERRFDEIYVIPETEEILEVLRGHEHDDYKLGYLMAKLKFADEDGTLVRFTGYDTWKKLDGLLDEILAQSGGRFGSKQQLFDEFAKANFTGNILPIARIVEGALGKGSFRRIAEEFRSAA